MTSSATTSSTVTVRFFAAAEEAAGTEAGSYSARDVAALRDTLIRTHPDLATVLPRCALLVDGVRADDTTSLIGAATVDVLPPFAGG